MKNKKENIAKEYFIETNEKKYEVVHERIFGDVKLHFHNYLEVELGIDGEAVQYINNHKTNLKRGSISILRPDVDCHELQLKSYNVYKFYTKSFFIDKELYEEISLLSDPLTIQLDEEELNHVINLFKAILYEQDKQEKYTDQIVKNAMDSILYFFVQKKMKEDSNFTIKRNIFQYLLNKDRYLTDVSLQDFADDFGYSLSHASKYFKENTGMTFSEAKQFFRLQRAKRLLLSTDYSIDEISSMCGFNYYHLFHNIFKRNTGMTPLEFKKKYK